MTHAILDGDWAKARELHFKMLPLFNDLFLDTNPIPVKTALRMMKRPSGVFRLPLCDMEPQQPGDPEEDAGGPQAALRSRRLLDMIDVAVAGATGKLGSMVCSLIQEQKDMRLVGAIVSAEGGKVGKELYPGRHRRGTGRSRGVCQALTVFVDVTNAGRGRTEPAIGGRAGSELWWSARPGCHRRSLSGFRSTVAEQRRSALVTPNFSIGVNVFWKACQILARALPRLRGGDHRGAP